MSPHDITVTFELSELHRRDVDELAMRKTALHKRETPYTAADMLMMHGLQGCMIELHHERQIAKILADIGPQCAATITGGAR